MNLKKLKETLHSSYEIEGIEKGEKCPILFKVKNEEGKYEYYENMNKEKKININEYHTIIKFE